MQVVSTWMLDGRIWVSSFRYLSTEESSSRQARVLPPPSWLVSSIKDIWQLHDSLSFFSCPPPTLFPPFSLQVLNWHPSIIFDVCDCYIFGKVKRQNYCFDLPRVYLHFSAGHCGWQKGCRFAFWKKRGTDFPLAFLWKNCNNFWSWQKPRE